MTTYRMLPKTHQDILNRIKRACEVMRSLPPVKVKGYLITWPEMPRETGAGDTDNKPAWSPLFATPAEIDDMEEVLFVWFKPLSVGERQLVWRRCNGMGWKQLAYHNRVSMRTVQRRMRVACHKIKDFLTGQQVAVPVYASVSPVSGQGSLSGAMHPIARGFHSSQTAQVSDVPSTLYAHPTSAVQHPVPLYK